MVHFNLGIWIAVVNMLGLLVCIKFCLFCTWLIINNYVKVLFGVNSISVYALMSLSNASFCAKPSLLYISLKIYCYLDYFQQTEMVEHIPSLMNAIRMIHSISQYYNTSERMTSLFVKVTNQMITTCKAYINRDVMKIWEHSRYIYALDTLITYKNYITCSAQ